MSTLNDHLHRLLDRYTLDTLMPWYAWDEEKQLVFMAHGYVGCILAVNLFSGIDDSITEEIESALAMNLPPDTFVQFIQMNVPDTERILSDYEAARKPIAVDEGLTKEQKSLLSDLSEQTATYFRDIQRNGKPIFSDSGVQITESHLYIAIKIPVAEFPTDAEIQLAHERILAFQSSMNSFSPSRLSREWTLAIWRRFFYMHGTWEQESDETRLLREQILGPGDAILDGLGHLTVEHGTDARNVISVLSIKSFTRPISAISTNFLMGDPLGKGSQLTVPGAIILTVRIPDQVKKRSELNTKFTVVNMQARGRLAKWSPRLGMRKDGIEFLIHALENGEHAVEMSLTALLWSQDQEQAKQATNHFMGHATKPGFKMLLDKYLTLPMFLNAIPLFPDMTSLAMTKRLLSATNTQAAVCAPITVDWSGNVGNGQRMTIPGAGSLMVSRRGHPVLFDLYASESGYNFGLYGRTRSGKSVTAQILVADQLALGAQVWVIEVGRSFEKLCRLLGGDHIDLRPDMEIGLNPFSVVENLHDELDELVGIFGTMISPRGDLNDEGLNTIERAIEAVFGNMGTDATPTHLAEYLSAQDNDDKAIKMGRMLYKFTEQGAYGHWFNAPMNVDLRGRFVNLELKEMETREHLLKVVLMQMMFAIGREISQSEKTIRRRVLFVDEASVLLKIPTAARFLEGLSRRVAKSRGSLGLGLQSLSDMYMNEHTKVIASQTAHFLVMKQHADVINQLQKDKNFSVSDYAYEAMRSLRKTGEFAECFINSEDSMGVVRIKLDPYRRVLFATDGPEKEEILAAMRAGVPADRAIREFLARNHEYIKQQESAGEEVDPEDPKEEEQKDYLEPVSDEEQRIKEQEAQQEAELAAAEAAKKAERGKERKRWLTR